MDDVILGILKVASIWILPLIIIGLLKDPFNYWYWTGAVSMFSIIVEGKSKK
jgi:hypothetical protein